MLIVLCLFSFFLIFFFFFLILGKVGRTILFFFVFILLFYLFLISHFFISKNSAGNKYFKTQLQEKPTLLVEMTGDDIELIRKDWEKFFSAAKKNGVLEDYTKFVEHGFFFFVF